jgi:hypothetical protein
MYRSMFPDATGEHPEIGDRFGRLGVRDTDVPADAQGNVRPNTGGMSVNPSLRDLPPELIPKRLRTQLGIPDARGKPPLCVWRMGEGPFVPAPVGDDLQLRPDHAGASHGNVEPARPMQRAEYRAALAATHGAWEIDER